MTGTLGRNPEASGTRGPTSVQFELAVLLENTPTSVPTKIVPVVGSVPGSTTKEFAGASGRLPVKSVHVWPALVVCQTWGAPNPIMATYAV